MIVGAIALWEGVKWLLEWWWLPDTKTVAEVRRERKLRKLQLAIKEELEVQGLGTSSQSPPAPEVSSLSLQMAAS